MSENRYDLGPAYTPGPPQPDGVVELQRTANPTQPLDLLRSAIPHYDAAIERTTAKDRAAAMTLRIVLWLLTVLLAGWGLYLIDVDLTLVALGAAVLLLLGYWWLTRLDYEYSGPGVARYAIDAAERLGEQQLALNGQLRKQALDAYLARLEQPHDR